MSVASQLPRMHGLKELLLSKNEIGQEGASALLDGLRNNVELLHLNVDSKLAEPIAREIDHYSRLNRAGRRILRQENELPTQIWTNFYSRVSNDKDVVRLCWLPIAIAWTVH
jgi:hypothetical protein